MFWEVNKSFEFWSILKCVKLVIQVLTECMKNKLESREIYNNFIFLYSVNFFVSSVLKKNIGTALKINFFAWTKQIVKAKVSDTGIKIFFEKMPVR